VRRNEVGDSQKMEKKGGVSEKGRKRERERGNNMQKSFTHLTTSTIL